MGEVQRPRSRKNPILTVVQDAPAASPVSVARATFFERFFQRVAGPMPTLIKRRSRFERVYSTWAFLTVVVMVGVFDGAVAHGLHGVTLALFLLFSWSVVGVFVCAGCYFGFKHSGIIKKIKNKD